MALADGNSCIAVGSSFLLWLTEAKLAKILSLLEAVEEKVT